MDQSYVRTLVNDPHHLKIKVEIADESLSRIDTDANLKHTYWNAHHFSEGMSLPLRMKQDFSTSGTERWESGQSIVNMTLLQLVPWNVHSIKVLSEVNQHVSHLSLRNVHGWVVNSPLWPCNVKNVNQHFFSVDSGYYEKMRAFEKERNQSCTPIHWWLHSTVHRSPADDFADSQLVALQRWNLGCMGFGPGTCIWKLYTKRLIQRVLCKLRWL